MDNETLLKNRYSTYLEQIYQKQNKEKADIMLQSRGLYLPKEKTYVSYLFYSKLHNICQARF